MFYFWHLLNYTSSGASKTGIGGFNNTTLLTILQETWKRFYGRIISCSHFHNALTTYRVSVPWVPLLHLLPPGVELAWPASFATCRTTQSTSTVKTSFCTTWRSRTSSVLITIMMCSYPDSDDSRWRASRTAPGCCLRTPTLCGGGRRWGGLRRRYPRKGSASAVFTCAPLVAQRTPKFRPRTSTTPKQHSGQSTAPRVLSLIIHDTKRSLLQIIPVVGSRGVVLRRISHWASGAWANVMTAVVTDGLTELPTSRTAFD